MAGDNGTPPAANDQPLTANNDLRVALAEEALQHAANLLEAFGLTPQQPKVLQNRAVRITVEAPSLIAPASSLIAPASSLPALARPGGG